MESTETNNAADSNPFQKKIDSNPLPNFGPHQMN